MKVAILNLTAGGMSGGYQKYLKNIIPRMAENSNIKSIYCLSPFKLNIFNSNKNLKVQFDRCNRFNIIKSNFDIDLKYKLERYSPDIIFIPMERYICFKNVPVVNMIQNMLPLFSSYNSSIYLKIRTFVQKQVTKYSIQHSQRVIAVSDFVRENLHEKFKIPYEKIKLIYHGSEFNENITIEQPKVIPDSWDKEFIFTGGSIDPYRGIEDIICATNLLNKNGHQIKIVISGEPSLNMNSYKENLQKSIRKNKLNNKVIWTGNLNEKEMSWCYKNCRFFVMTSKVEACPNIALEAMVNGCIIVSTDNLPMPEFFKDAAYYYKSGNAQNLADKIKQVLSLKEEEIKLMSEKAKKRAAQFSWDICAEKTVELLKDTIEKFY